MRIAALTAVLCAWLALSGCSVAGVVLGGAVGLALAGPEGAVAGSEAGFYVGACLDAAIIGSTIAEEQNPYEPYEPEVIVVDAPPAGTGGWDPPSNHEYDY